MLFPFFSQLTSNTTFTNLAEQISRIEPPYPHDWLPYSSSDELLGTSAPDGRHRYSASEEDDEDEEEVNLVRVRPRTGSLSEHEDLLALKAQAQAVIRREEAGYDVSFQVVNLVPRAFSLTSGQAREKALGTRLPCCA